MSVFFRAFIISLYIIVGTATFAQSPLPVPPMAMTIADTSLHTAPGLSQPVLVTLPIRTAVFIEGRDQNAQWMQVRTIDETAQGWVSVDKMLLSADVILTALPVSAESAQQADVQQADSGQSLSTFFPDTPAGNLARLQSIPVLYNMFTPQVEAIFARGQSMRNRADVFIKVGDSNTKSGAFLRPLGMEERGYCNLGTYTDLQATIDFFSVSPREPYANSFDSLSMTAQDGIGTPGLLDPFWATDPTCNADESLMECEYRLTKPSVAIIMIGMLDMKIDELDNYRANLETIITLSEQRGVIPVLTTYSVLPDAVNPAAPMWDAHLEMNRIMVEAAEKHGIPLINLWSALQSLPDYGIGPDRSHLKYQVGSFCTFTGAEKEIGGTLRNLVTLQALDDLRRNVLTR